MGDRFGGSVGISGKVLSGESRLLSDRFAKLKPQVWVSLGLVALCLAAYAPLLTNGFVEYDDQVYITANPHVRDGFSWAGLRAAFALEHHGTGMWHPLTWLSHMLDCQLFGLWPPAHHAVSLALHVANVVWLFLLWRRMTGMVWPSAMVAALFAVHPLNVESVAWAAERKNVLSTFFWLASTWVYVSYVELPTVPRYVGAVALFVLGLLAKPMLVTLPFALLLLDYWPLERATIDLTWRRIPLSEQMEGWRPLMIEKVPFLLFSAASAGVTIYTQQDAMAQVETFGLLARLGTAIAGYAIYLRKLAWPVDLAVLYPLDLSGPPLAVVVLSACVLLGITLVIFWRGRRQSRALRVGWLWFLGTLFPVCGLLQAGIHATADRYAYVPQWGIFIALCFAMAQWAQPRTIRPWPWVGAAAAVLLLLWGLTFAQVRVWRTRLTLFDHALAVGAESATAHINVATDLYFKIQAEKRRGMRKTDADYQAVLTHYRQALKLKPDDLGARNSLARLLTKLNRLREAEIEFDYLLSIAPDDIDALFNRGLARFNLGRLSDAAHDFERVIELNRDHAQAHYNLARVLLAMRRRGEALPHLRAAMALNPNDLLVRGELAELAIERQTPDEAISILREMVSIEPRRTDTRNQLALLLVQGGYWADAAAELAEILGIEPENLSAINALARIRATAHDPALRDGNQALELAKKACDATKNGVPICLDTLAAAYAELGRFDEAAKTAEQGVVLAERQNRIDLAQQIQERVNMYRNQQPLREGPPASPKSNG